MTNPTTSPEFFEQKYKCFADPWDFASSTYELDRYKSTCEMLRGRYFQSAFEPGCSIGVLTEMLAAQCKHLYAVDVSPSAVVQAKNRCANLHNVEINCGALPDALLDQQFDLVVFSEIGYYFDEARLYEVGEKLVSRLLSSGTFLAVHWLGHSPDHILTGDRVHAILAELPQLTLEASERHPGFRIDRWFRV